MLYFFFVYNTFYVDFKTATKSTKASDSYKANGNASNTVNKEKLDPPSYQQQPKRNAMKTKSAKASQPVRKKKNRKVLKTATEEPDPEKYMNDRGFKYKLDIQRETFTSLSKEEQNKYKSNLRQYALSAKSRTLSSSLRFDWGNLPPMTKLGKLFDNTQNQCQHPESKNELVKWKLMGAGMGSSIHTYSNALCEATYHNRILITDSLDSNKKRWSWNEKEHCDDLIKSRDRSSNADLPHSLLWCYFGSHESGERCPKGSLKSTNFVEASLEDMYHHPCREWYTEYGRQATHGAAMEFLFQNVTDIVIQEAEKQMKEMNVVPTEDFITIHIRWGDKWREMKLVSIEDYVNATKKILTKKERNGEVDVNIYIASEDPIAIQKFKEVAPSHWIIHQSGPKVSKDGERMKKIANSSGGKAGLESLGALLISMQANRYVLSTGSNWSRLINELRKNIVDPRCGKCTTVAEFVDRISSFL